ncbi:aquaporin [uncultured Planktomarina sp.]|uniref:aquaporin n=2 Tax=Planktomarina TaxID=1284657 RepID=UPI0032604534
MFAEFLGAGLLLIAVVGSGIMAETLADGNTALALLANAIATGCMLYCIITLFGPVSGAHFNPIVTLAFVVRGDMPIKRAGAFIAAQIFGAIAGVLLTHAMFDQSLFQMSQTSRTGAPLWISEIFGSFGLLLIIFGGLAQNSKAIASMVALYITGAYWFTASTSFANPAVSIARALSDTFAGIYPAHVPMFILCQLIGMALALVAVRAIYDRQTSG